MYTSDLGPTGYRIGAMRVVCTETTVVAVLLAGMQKHHIKEMAEFNDAKLCFANC